MKISKLGIVLFLPSFSKFFLWLSHSFDFKQKNKIVSIMTTNPGDETNMGFQFPSSCYDGFTHFPSDA